MNKEKKIKSTVLLFVIGAFFCTLCGIALRIINVLKFYDTKIGYFQDAALPLVMNIFFFVAVLLFAVACFVLERKKALDNSANTPMFFKVISAVCAAASLIQAFNTVTDLSDSRIHIFFGLSLIGSALYFSLNLLKKTPAYNAIFSLFPAVSCVFILGMTYFDVLTQMNSPHKVLIHVTCIACMLTFLGEARLIADQKRKKTYFFFITSALFFTGVSSIPSTVLYFSNSFDYSYIDFDLTFLVFFVYFAARTVTLCLTQKEELKPEKTDELTAEHLPDTNETENI